MSEKYNVITYGCQMNEHDSEKISGMLENMNYEPVENPEEADVVVINTCLIRENAELTVYGKVGALKKLKEENPDMVLAVGGCMMQKDEPAERLYQKHPQVDIIFGTHNLHRIPALIEQIKSGEEQIIEIWDEPKAPDEDTPVKRKNDFQAWVTIIKGCDNYCSYCVVPYVRGPERSRSKNKIIQEVKELAAEGVKEITLLGQNVNAYGQDLERNYSFSQLLGELTEIKFLQRIRFMTSHPRDFNEDIIKTVTKNKKLCSHYHLPVQSGSSKILERMNRGYTRNEYLELINKIRNIDPGASITSDIIVGFPGETEEDFQKTLSLVRKCRFDMAFTFAYSSRPGTAAENMEKEVDSEEKKARLHKLMEVQNKISKEKNKQLVGEKLEVLVEGESKKNSDNYSSRTETNKLVIVPGKPELKGKIIPVEITEAGSWTLYGKILYDN